MLNQKYRPTPLLEPDEQPPITLKEIPTQHRFRLLYLLKHSTLLGVKIVWLKLRRQLNNRILGILLRDLFQQFGILWIKIGQLLAMRVDLFPAEVCTALSQLHNQANGFSPELAKHLIETELGQPIEVLFSHFEAHPFAAASISQVHRATLRSNQCTVAIKVRKPNAEQLFHADMRIIRRLVRLLQWLSIRPYMRWQEMQWEIEQLMIEELDYEYEAANMRRMRKSLKAHHIYVPKVFMAYSSPSLLTMEYVAGVLMSDYLKTAQQAPERVDTWLQHNHIDPTVVGRRLFLSLMRQLMEDNLFHADLHPGNIMLLRNSRIACIDFGSIGFMNQEFLEKYTLYLNAVTQQHYGKAFDLFLHFPKDIPATDLTALKAEFTHILQACDERCRIPTLAYTEKSLIVLNDTFLQVLSRYHISMTWDFLRMTRALATADAAFRELIPALDSIRLMQTYLRQRMARGMQQPLKPQSWQHQPNTAALLQLPSSANEAMMLQNTIIRKQAYVQCGQRPVAHAIQTLLSIWIFILRLTACVCLLEYLQQQALIETWLPLHWPRLDGQVWLLMLLACAYLHRVMVQLKQQYRAQYPQHSQYHF